MRPSFSTLSFLSVIKQVFKFPLQIPCCYCCYYYCCFHFRHFLPLIFLAHPMIRSTGLIVIHWLLHFHRERVSFSNELGHHCLELRVCCWCFLVLSFHLHVCRFNKEHLPDFQFMGLPHILIHDTFRHSFSYLCHLHQLAFGVRVTIPLYCESREWCSSTQVIGLNCSGFNVRWTHLVICYLIGFPFNFPHSIPCPLLTIEASL